ncbi:hypothetical protein [Saccharopolyspora taberi]|uniref:Uncharacterized protein n=1 Tax=Saccharopolyspora taberi TaxID=60895 RepID=A0ABN3VK73_9PSEU
MTARPDAPSPAGNPPKPTIAIAAAAVGALLLGLAPIAGLVEPDLAAAFPSWPLLLVLAVLPPALALLFGQRDRPGTAAAVLIAPAVLAPARIVLDLQLVVDAGLAARPELLLPNTLDPLRPATGVWLLIAGHVATVVAGVLAFRGREPGDSGADSGSRRQGLLAGVLCASVVAAVGALMTPFSSDDPYLLPRAAVDSPVVVLVGGLLLALAVPCVGGFVAGSADPDVARGGLLGLALAIAGVAVPPVFAAAVVDALHFEAGPVLMVLAAVALAVLALPAGRIPSDAEAGELLLPTLSRLLTTAGVLALIAGVLFVLAALTPQLEMPSYLSQPPLYSARMLWPAGLVLAGLGITVLVPGLALLVRPVLTVAWSVLPLVAAAVLDTVFTAVQGAGATAEIGAWAAGVGVLVGIAAAIVAALAGGVERDDVDLTENEVNRTVLALSAVAGVLGALSLVLPVIVAPGYTPPGVFSDFSTTSWGLVAALTAVIGAALLAPRCRPARASALLCGGGVVVAVRVLELPLTAARAEGSGPGLGLWAGIAALVMFACTAVVAARARAEKAFVDA